MGEAREPRCQVVVTGLGCVTPLGAGTKTGWEALLAGRSGVRRIADLDERIPVRIGAPAEDLGDPGELPAKDRRRMDRVILLCLAAAREALCDARLLGAERDVDPERIGVAIGSGIGGVESLLRGHRTLLEHGPRRLSPFTIPMTLANMPAGLLAIRHGLRGPNLCHVTACASGAHALGESLRKIQTGEADVMVAGGCEAALLPLVIGGFAAMHALSSRNEEPERASRPFDRDRDGFVLGEGSAVLVLERAEHARARGARVRARLLGYGASADAAKLAAPDLECGGALRCMRAALQDGGRLPRDLDYVNAHATSTPAGDRVEAQSLRQLLGRDVEGVAVSSTKGTTGHLLGAAGAVEALFTVLALEAGLLPPTLNLDRPDPDCQLDHVAGKVRAANIQLALSNSFGFGGVNAALLFERWEA